MSIYFISDLHLSEQHPEITEKFAFFLQTLPADTEKLYILGDLFEVWVGDDENTVFQQEIAALIKNASKKFPVYFMAGNRDFSLGKKYCTQSGMLALTEPSVVLIQGEPTLLLHGDSLCTQDKSHQIFRGIIRSRLTIGFLLTLPLSWRKKLGVFLRKKSMGRNQRISSELMDVHFASLKSLMQKFNVRQVIYGHTHRPSIFYFDINKQINKVFVLSDWGKQGHALVFSEGSFGHSVYF